jgi:multiple sugar transport system substrate-binding protein
MRMRRWLIGALGLLGCLILGLGTVGGIPGAIATGSQTTPRQPIHLSFLVGAYEVPTWKPILQQFEAQHPQIRVDMVEGPSSPNLIEDLYTSAFLLGDSPYDLVYMDIPWVAKFAAAGWLADLSGRVTEADRAQFLTGDWDGGRYQDGLYRFPGARSDASLLYYRKDLLDAAGLKPPATFAEMVAIARQFQTRTPNPLPWGYLWQGKQYEGVAAMFTEVLAGFGGVWVDPKTLAVGLDRPEAIAAANFLHQTLEEGLSPPGVVTYQEEETRRIFQNGEAVFLRNWPYVWTLANGDDSKVKGKIGIAPMLHQPGLTSPACQGGWGWGIAQGSRHPEEAWQLVQFLSSEAVQKQTSLASGNLPTRRSLYQDPELLARYPHFSPLLQVLEGATLRPAIAQYAQASDILQRYLSAAFTQQLSPEAAMRAAARETRDLLGQRP